VYVTAYTIIPNYQLFIIYNYASMNKTVRFKKDDCVVAFFYGRLDLARDDGERGGNGNQDHQVILTERLFAVVGVVGSANGMPCQLICRSNFNELLIIGHLQTR
jgi:hypothetical protein